MQLGRMKQRKIEKRKWDRTFAPGGGELKERRGSLTQGSPLTGMEINWDREELWGIKGAATSPGQSETYADGPRHSLCTPS